MPRPSLRSTALRKIKRKIPGGASIIHYFRKKPSRPRCSACGETLPGTASARRAKMTRISRTKRRPNRAYGGNLCSRCARKTIKTGARR